MNDIKSLAAELGLKCIKAYKMNSLKAVLEENVMETAAIQLEKPVLKSEDKEDDSASVGTEGSHGISSADRSKKEERKAKRRLVNGPGIDPVAVENCAVKGFPKKSFDRVLLDAPCSALGLRPRLFAGDVRFHWQIHCLSRMPLTGFHPADNSGRSQEALSVPEETF